MAFAISATVIGTITYLSLYVQNTLGYSPVQGGLRFLPLFLVSFAVALLTGRLIGKVAVRVLLGVAMAAAAAGLASIAHLSATSTTWLVLLPGFILAGIGLGITSTGLFDVSAVCEPSMITVKRAHTIVPPTSGPVATPEPHPSRVAGDQQQASHRISSQVRGGGELARRSNDHHPALPRCRREAPRGS